MFLIHLYFEWDPHGAQERTLSCSCSQLQAGLWTLTWSPPQRIPARLSGQSCCCTIRHMRWRWSMCGKPHGSEWGPELCFQECFQKAFILDTRLTWTPAVTVSGDHTDHFLLLAEGRSQGLGDRRHPPLDVHLWQWVLCDCHVELDFPQLLHDY